MMAPTTKHGAPLAQVLLSLESGHDEEALMVAIQLAKAMKAQLLQQFIENTQLLQIAELPFSREIRLTTAGQYPLTPSLLLQQLQDQANRSRQRLAQLAQQYQLEWHFEVLRGGASRMVPPAPGLRVYGRRVLPPRQVPSTGPILTLFDGSAASRLGLKTALNLSARGEDVLILLLPDADRPLTVLKAAVQTLIAQEHGSLPKLPFISASIEQLRTLSRAYHARLLVLGAEAEHLPAELIEALLENSPCPLVFIPPESVDA